VTMKMVHVYEHGADVNSFSCFKTLLIDYRI
jgi:hypothetical protein